jgi:hypothetical protein
MEGFGHGVSFWQMAFFFVLNGCNVLNELFTSHDPGMKGFKLCRVVSVGTTHQNSRARLDLFCLQAKHRGKKKRRRAYT